MEQKDLQRDPFWGNAYLMYRAGRKNDFYKLLSAKKKIELLKEFQDYDQSVDEMRPQCAASFWNDNAPDDIFYNQLIYILKGVPKFSSSALCDPETVDIVWVLLRCVGLYLDDP